MRRLKGFTLVELVIVILIVGILAAVAAPRFFRTSANAVDAGLKRNLSTIRDSIHMFMAENGGNLPGASDGMEATFKSDLVPFFRGDFPKAPVGPALGSDGVFIVSAGVPLAGEAAPLQAWKYDYTTGEFIFNYNGASTDASMNYDEF